MGRPPICNCWCTPTPDDCAAIVCPDAKHSNTEGDASLYTLSNKTWGTGLTINSYSLANESSLGHDAPCMRLSVNWSQSKVPPYWFPSIIPPGGLGYDALFGAWVIATLNGGPQVSLSAGEWLKNVSLQANTKRINVSPSVASMGGRYLIQGVPAHGLTPTTGPLFTGGTFRLAVDSDATGSIAFDADAAAVQAALESLPSVGSGGVIVSGGLIGQNFFSLRFTDGVDRVVSGDGTTLTPDGTFGSHPSIVVLDHLRHFDYSIIPVVIQGGVVYGPSPLTFPIGYGLRTADGNEAAWQCRRVSAICDGATPVGSYSQSIHSRYREFLENTLAYPAGVDNPACQRYCRDDDQLGDWSAATIQRWNPTITTTAEFPEWDTWIPPTPDLSVGDYTLGFAVQFYSDEPGDFSADLLIDNLCLDWTVRPAIEPCGTLATDEPMSSDVPTWSSSDMSTDPPSGNCDFSEQYYGASWRIDSGFLITDHVLTGDGITSEPIGDYSGATPYFWRDRIYAGGSLFKTLDASGPGSVWRNTNFCLTVECELQRIHEEDAEWYAADEGSPNLNLHRPCEDFGIFIGGMAKFGVMRNARIYGESSDNHTCNRSWYYLQVDGNIGTNGELATLCADHDSKGYYCPDAEGDGEHFIYYQQHALDTKRDGDTNLATAVPLKNDKLRLEVRWSALEATVNDCGRNGRYKVKAWVNDQESFSMYLAGSSPSIIDVSQLFIGDPFWIHPPSVGVFAHQGGKFRNFKAWLTPS